MSENLISFPQSRMFLTSESRCVSRYVYDVSHDLFHDVSHDLFHDVSHDLFHDVSHDLFHDVSHDLFHDMFVYLSGLGRVQQGNKDPDSETWQQPQIAL
jgi:hypothetical protein